MKSDPILDKFLAAHSKIKTANHILIVSPAPPDADSITSCLLLSEYLKLPWLNKPHTLYCTQTVPQPEENLLLKFFKSDLLQFSLDLPRVHPTCIALVDYGNFKTAGLNASDFMDAEFIGFDHHDQPADDFPENGLQIIDQEAASTTALLYHYFCYIGVPISKAMATYITVGILADTGRLTNPKANADALRIVANCIEKGIPWDRILEAMQPRISKNRLHVWAQIALHSMSIGAYGFISAVVSKNNLNHWGGTAKDAESLLGWKQMLEDARVTVLILEQGDREWKIALRSKVPREISVAKIARRLGGGGHPHMAAAIWSGDPFDAEEILRKEVVSILQKS